MNLMLILLQNSVETADTTLKLIERYGITTVAVVFLAIFGLFLVKWIIKKEKKQNDRLVEIENRFLDFLEKNKKHEITEEILDDHAKNSYKVQTLIFNLLNTFKADRIMIYEYHNGGKTLTGVNFIKCTCTYDATELGIPSKKIEYSNLPISTHYLWNKILLEKKPVIISDVNNEKDVVIKQILKADKIKSYYNFLLLDYDTKPIGFMTVEYLNKKYILSEEEMNYLSKQAIIIAGLIT